MKFYITNPRDCMMALTELNFYPGIGDILDLDVDIYVGKYKVIDVSLDDKFEHPIIDVEVYKG